MKILESLKSRKLAKVLSAVVLGGSLLAGSGDVSAASDPAATMKFREAYLTTYSDTRSFDQVLTFFGGTVFKADITADSQILKDASMRIKGTVNWSYTSPKTKQTTNLTIPFYIAQDGNSDITLYVNRNRKWSKVSLPGFPSALANIIKTNDRNILQENMNAVKDVSIFKDDDKQRIMRLVVDGDYVAGLFDKYEDQNSEAAVINRNLKKALSDEDVFITWTVNKQTRRTETIVVELTDLVRNYARNILNESAAGTIKLSQEEMALMDSIGYYSEFHYSLTYRNTADNSDLNFPSGAANAKENNDVLDDLESDMVQVVKK